MTSIRCQHLLIIPKENLNRQPSITANLKAILQVIKLVNLLITQLNTINLIVRVNASLANRLRNNTPPLVNTPNKQNLLRRLALVLGNLQQGGILVQGGVGGAQAGVASGVDALGGVVGNQLGGGVVGVQLDLVYGWDDLGGGVVEEDLEVLDAEVGDSDVADLAGGGELLHFLPGKS